MGNVQNSIDNMLASASANGLLTRFWCDNNPATTAANATSGYNSACRYNRTFTVPSLGSGLTGVYFPTVRTIGSASGTINVVALETLLGTLTVSGNSFAAGSAMPTKTVAGASVQTASIIPVLVVDTALTATTPAITITYTDQDGNTGNTATLTLPSNAAAQTVFLIAPHLASGDTGVRAVTNLSTSAGTAGVLKVYGLLPLKIDFMPNVNLAVSPDPMTIPLPGFLAAANDVVAVYRIGSTSAGDIAVVLSGVADN